ncbi:uncharacterized protein LOC115223368 [Argonauta hians]
MEQFFGKWVEFDADKAAKRNFMEKLENVPKEIVDKITSLQAFIDLEKDGDYYKSTLGYIGDPSLTKSYRYKLNETFSDVDGFGVKFTITARLDGNKFYDTITYLGNTTETVREVADGIMVWQTSANGQTLITKLKKQ